jgi:hypothetical protein
MPAMRRSVKVGAPDLLFYIVWQSMYLAGQALRDMGTLYLLKETNMKNNTKFPGSKGMLLSSVVALMAMALLSPVASAATTQGIVKQPVFLICPSTAKNSAWSVYVVVDGSDHSKILALGLDELTGVSSFGSSYARVLEAQSDPNIKRKLLASLDARDFDSGELAVKKDDALHMSLTPRADGSFEVMCDVRVGSSDRFFIGGKEKAKRAVALKYYASSGTWHTEVEALSDSTGAKVAHAIGLRVTGVLFPVTGTGIYVIALAFEDGTGVCLLDR